MSSVTFRHEDVKSFKKNGIKNTIKEKIIDGATGLTIMYLEKKGDDFYKLYVKELEKDKFEITEKKGEVEEPKTIISEKNLLKMLKTHKLENMINYISNDRGTYKGKKVSKKIIKIKGYENSIEGGSKKK